VKPVAVVLVALIVVAAASPVAKGAADDPAVELEAALIAAIDDEYKARATYQKVLETLLTTQPIGW